MDDEQNEDREPRERPRPRVVDKRVSARPRPSTEQPEPDAGSAREQSEPAAETVPEERGPEPAGGAQPEEAPPPPPSPGLPGSPPAEPPTGGVEAPPVWTPEQEEQARRIAEEIARTPAIDLIITFTMNFVEVASVKLQVGDLAGAQLAIDAFEGVVKALGPKLGEAEGPMRSYLAQLQMAYAQRAAPPTPGPRPS